MTPVPAGERIEFLDVLRGAALFGILASNMRAFNGPMAAYFDHNLMWTGTVDKVVQGFIDLFISGKFITLFAFLFGIGFAIQMDRARDRGESQRFYLRRSAVLLAFGLIHMLLLWWGDILMPYALMSFALFLLRNRSQKAVVGLALAFYMWPVVPMLAGTIATSLGVQIPPMTKTTPAELQRVIAVYASGSYAQIVAEHLKEFSFQVMGIIFYMPRLVGIFLAGLWVWRAGILRDLGERVALLKKCATIGLVAGLAGNAAWVAIAYIWSPDPMGFSWSSFIMGLLQTAALPLLSMSYASALALVYVQSAEWRRRLNPFRAVGRTALTNYLMQTVICTTIFNSWGLGLFGTVNPLAGFVLTVAIYSGLTVASTWYVSRFEFGPVEWLWRKLTYGRVRERPISSVAETA